MIELTLKQIADADDRKIEFVPCPEWAPKGTENPNECGIYVMSLTVEERDDFEKSLALEARRTKAKFGVDNYRARFVARVLCDANGVRTATDRHWELLCKRGSGPMSRIFDKAAALSGLTDNDVEEATKQLDVQSETPPEQKNGQPGAHSESNAESR